MKRLILTQENRLASVEGRKNQTRRVIVPQPPKETVRIIHNLDGWFGYDENHRICWNGKPKHQVGDILAMPEPYLIKQLLCDVGYPMWVVGKYLDDEKPFRTKLKYDEWKKYSIRKKPYMRTSARFMYDSLIRYWFKVTRVRVEELQDISEEDAIAEGITAPRCPKCGYTNQDCYIHGDHNRCSEPIPRSATQCFLILWDPINKKRGYGWDENNWVFVYDYERTKVKKNGQGN